MATSASAHTAPLLFISYSHDSPDHEDRVLALANRLREDGIDAILDQYHPTPPEGWPMWMEGQMRKAAYVALICTPTYLRRVENRDEPGKGRGVLWEATLIYNLLYTETVTIQRFIPVFLNEATESSIPLPLRGSTRYQIDTDKGYEDFYRHLTCQPRHTIPDLGKLKSLPVALPRSYPASLTLQIEGKASASLEHRNRSHLLTRVRLVWINGLLKQSLYNVAPLELGLQSRPDAVECKATIQFPGRLPEPIKKGTTIGQIFDEHGRAMLILGLPGTGKTTLLLRLAEQLLDRCQQDENQPVPVVFNLSSWAAHRPSLDRWLISELNERNDVPLKFAKQWLQNEQIIPLLDGLDEVALESRQACVEAINLFRRDHGLLPIAVCSRIADYETLGAKLRLYSAIVVQPLTRPEVVDYLASGGELFQSLRAALEKDGFLWDLLETPLMLWVAMLAYSNAGVDLPPGNTNQELRNRIFGSFVDAMLKRRPSEALYTPEQSISWLHWLASVLKRNEKTVFYLEQLRPDWLETPRANWSARLAPACAAGLIYGLTASCAVAGDVWRRLELGSLSLIFGFAWMLVTTLAEVRPQILLYPVNRQGLLQVRVGSFLKLAQNFAFRIALVGLSIAGAYIVFFMKPEPSSYLLLPKVGFILLLAGFIPLAILAFSSRLLRLYLKPNVGISFGMRAALLSAAIWGPIIVAGDRLLFSQDAGPNTTLFVVLLGTVTGAMAFGGLPVLSHFGVRFVLWRRGLAPVHYVRFLDYATERLFLRRIGSGYIFTHHLLREYFISCRTPTSLTAALRADGGELTSSSQPFSERTPKEQAPPVASKETRRFQIVANTVMLLSLLILVASYQSAFNPEILRRLGNIWEVMPMGFHDYSRARELYERAATRNDVDAMVDLGQLNDKLHDETEATRWYERAAAAGDVTSMAIVGRLYAIHSHPNEAFVWLGKAAAAGNEDAKALFWRISDNYGTNYQTAFKWLEESAHHGDPIAMHTLGEWHQNGRYVSQNYKEACFWYEAAARRGYQRAMEDLLDLYIRGACKPENIAAVSQWITTGPLNGDTGASLRFGQMYFFGRGTPKDYQEARTWFLRTAVGNDYNAAQAQEMLGEIYWFGEGVSPDHSQACSWYKQAADGGNKHAMLNFARLVDSGSCGPIDHDMACQWVQKGATDINASQHSLLVSRCLSQSLSSNYRTKRSESR
ncbi:MAG TPA: TIR domain-containing protein [Candidatus Angelobacter sp.]|nr:TIR domain-containing protein [Candidatus Angelobacter sp.]